MASNQQPSIVDQPPESEHSWIPDGCVILVGPDGQRYVVPAFMGLAMRQVFEGQKKKDLMTFGALGTVSLIMCPACLFSLHHILASISLHTHEHDHCHCRHCLCRLALSSLPVCSVLASTISGALVGINATGDVTAQRLLRKDVFSRL
jgi:hypothetical protein